MEEFLEQGCKGASWEFLWIFCSSFGEQKLRRSQKQLSECLNNIFQSNEKLRTPLLLPLTSITLEHLFRRRGPDRSLSEGQVLSLGPAPLIASRRNPCGGSRMTRSNRIGRSAYPTSSSEYGTKGGCFFHHSQLAA